MLVKSKKRCTIIIKIWILERLASMHKILIERRIMMKWPQNIQWISFLRKRGGVGNVLHTGSINQKMV